MLCKWRGHYAISVVCNDFFHFFFTTGMLQMSPKVILSSFRAPGWILGLQSHIFTCPSPRVFIFYSFELSFGLRANTPSRTIFVREFSFQCSNPSATWLHHFIIETDLLLKKSANNHVSATHITKTTNSSRMERFERVTEAKDKSSSMCYPGLDRLTPLINSIICLTLKADRMSTEELHTLAELRKMEQTWVC